jgi:hypothetical protein
MKRLLFLPLLALPLLLLSCDGQVPTEPAAPDAPGILLKPIPTNYSPIVSGSCTLASGTTEQGTWECSGPSIYSVGVWVYTNKPKGQLAFYRCHGPGGSPYEYNACDSGGYRWRLEAKKPLIFPSAETCADGIGTRPCSGFASLNLNAVRDGGTWGIKFKYMAQGSGTAPRENNTYRWNFIYVP